MTDTQTAHLSDRSVLQVTGEDAQNFLQGLVTNDLDKLGPGTACHAALLTPQGKILFDFFVVRSGDSYLIDVDRDKAAELAKRLGFYKLRAKVEISDLSEAMSVSAAWDGSVIATQNATVFDDPRLKAMGQRIIAPVDDITPTIAIADYHAHRIGLGIPEGGKDFAFGGAFPHEVNMDVLNGVDFEKGCYVGQEVVSRMHHKSKVRKRIVPVGTGTGAGTSADASVTLPDSGADIRAGKALLGTLGSTAGTKGLALIRLDRAAEAIEKGDAILAGDVAINLHQPSWASFDVPRRQE